MKAPSWIEINPRMTKGLDKDGKPCAVVSVRIRRWHPYVWWLLLKAAWKAIT